MKILVDMNLSPKWVDFLIEAGFDAIHWSAVGPTDASDDAVMQWAAEHEHVVLRSDLDFGAILAVSRNRRPSVLQLRSDLLTPAGVGGVVVTAIRQTHEALHDGALVSINAARARLRVLPLGG